MIRYNAFMIRLNVEYDEGCSFKRSVKSYLFGIATDLLVKGIWHRLPTRLKVSKGVLALVLLVSKGSVKLFCAHLTIWGQCLAGRSSQMSKLVDLNWFVLPEKGSATGAAIAGTGDGDVDGDCDGVTYTMVTLIRYGDYDSDCDGTTECVSILSSEKKKKEKKKMMRDYDSDAMAVSTECVIRLLPPQSEYKEQR
ncbi:hypothetical protein Tco_0074147 [Tanacetum coccineum]